MLSEVERARANISRNTGAAKKAQLGQYLTPVRTARFMADLIDPSADAQCRLLDAGAGIGSLACAFLERCADRELTFDAIDLTAYELDETLHSELSRSLARYGDRLRFNHEIVGGDFVEAAVNSLQFAGIRFTHAVLNPPYMKIASASRHRLLLRQVGIETVNLYSAFVALALSLMAPGGQLVAIIPRSFCNGPYYRPFRERLLECAAIRHIHLFHSRNSAFKDDKVLQENVILKVEVGGRHADVRVSSSSDDTFHDLLLHTHPYERIVFPGDSERFIHVPTTMERGAIESLSGIRFTLDEVGVAVSTGPVVDFRLKKHLRAMPERGTAPLVYPCHFRGPSIVWPCSGSKKPNAIARNGETEKWLFPIGYYCLVRRFSSKEEKRRIVAGVVDPESFVNFAMLGFENHLNVFHSGRLGLPETLARGMAAYLNSSAVDEQFRRYNGHTQVNATDLRMMKYPSREALITLGRWSKRKALAPTQSMLDRQLEVLTR